MEHGSEAALVAAVQAGSSEAYEELYQRYADRIYRYILARLRDTELAKDVLQETFLVLWHKNASYSGKSSIATWLFGIATNKMRESARSAARVGELRPEADETVAADEGPEQAGIRLDVLSAIRKLPPDQQEVIILTFYADLRHTDIAEIQGVPVGTVKSRMFQAKKALKENLG